MEISGLVCTLTENIVDKLFNFMRFLVFLSGPVHTAISTIAYSVVHFEEFRLVVSTTYVIFGAAVSISLCISMYIQSKDIERLLIQIENLVNESKYFV